MCCFITYYTIYQGMPVLDIISHFIVARILFNNFKICAKLKKFPLSVIMRGYYWHFHASHLNWHSSRNSLDRSPLKYIVVTTYIILN